MGRHKMTRDPNTVLEQRRRWWNAYTQRRMIRRETDPEYREQIVEQARARYREEHNVQLKDCRENLGALDQIGTVRTVTTPSGETMEMLTFDAAELAEALGDYNPQIMYRWQQKGQLPRPVVRMFPPRNQKGFVYLEDEVRAIMENLGAHQCRFAYFRVSDKETIENIHNAVADVREGYGIDSDD